MPHHPPEEYLIDLASGAAGEGVALLLRTHLAMCPPCGVVAADLDRIGGILLEDGAGRSLQTLAHPALPALATAPGRAHGARIALPQHGSRGIPEPLRAFVGASFDALNWRMVWPGVHELNVPGLDPREGLKLLRIREGMALPKHTHEGDELTLVLTGGYTDATGHYVAGDVALADDEISHQPKADPGTACICLTAVERPLRFTGFFARIISRLLIKDR